MTEPEVLPLFIEPEREDSLRQISLALLSIRADGVTCKEIARKIGCHYDTVEAASNEHSLLSFDSIAKLCFHYPKARPFIVGLWGMGASAEPTETERFERIERELAALRDRRVSHGLEYGRAGGLGA